jgi:hypothetical protein
MRSAEAAPRALSATGNAFAPADRDDSPLPTERARPCRLFTVEANACRQQVRRVW